MLSETKLFTEVSTEESATVSGGLTFNLDDYLFVIGAGVIFGNPGLTEDEVQFGWELAIQ
ncbi:MAG: hypothetical protein QNJ36_11880 [Calothrix sp. MO_167.B42]|nr:hypothetical protein [Calothrix sp. MO_167.B42]